MNTVPHEESTSSTRPMMKRQRVSSHDLYQSMSVLRSHGFEKDFLQRHRRYIHGHGLQRAGFVNDVVGSGVRQHGQHPALSPHACNARRAKARIGSVSVEDELNAA